MLAKLRIRSGGGQSHRMSHKNDIPESGDVADGCNCAVDPQTKVLPSRDNLSRLKLDEPTQISPMLLRRTVPRTREWLPLQSAAFRPRSEGLSARLARCRSGRRMPPEGEITEKTDEDSRSNRRPIELIDSPACQRSQISARWAAE
ncbi:MAG: hypothetical protein ACRC9K_20410 [Afipia sp.]